MAKSRTQYTCQACGYVASKWLGRCPGCEEWSSLVEERINTEASKPSARDSVLEMAGVHGVSSVGTGKDYVSLDPDEGEAGTEPQHLRRLATGIGELDRVLGGGLVPDSLVLIGGDPGIGKSTLLLQMTRGLREKNDD
ncbi:MAG TPA: hypothetical protein VM598_00005, partial [Bdellovibrionota bacterium]|nr:hypothetical protein [Bdellovibrionota bacterium]